MGALLDAAYRVVHRCVGGAVALEARLGISRGGLSAQVRAVGTAKLGLETALEITHMTGDLDILHTFAELCGQMCVPMPELLMHGGQPDELLSQLAQSSADYSGLCSELLMDMSDGQISDNELARITTLTAAITADMHRLNVLARRRNADGKPQGVGA